VTIVDEKMTASLAWLGSNDLAMLQRRVVFRRLRLNEKAQRMILYCLYQSARAAANLIRTLPTGSGTPSMGGAVNRAGKL